MIFRVPQILFALSGRTETDLSISDFLEIGWASTGETTREIVMLPGDSIGKSWKLDHTIWSEMGSQLFPLVFLDN